MNEPPDTPRPAQPPPDPRYPPYPYPPYQPPFNVYAILSLVFAVAVFPPLGIYFGKRAQQQIAERGERGIELANAGVVCGWIFTAIQGLVLLLFCGLAIPAIVFSASST